MPHRERANTATFLEEVITYVAALQKRNQELEGLHEQPSNQMVSSLSLARQAPPSHPAFLINANNNKHPQMQLQQNPPPYATMMPAQQLMPMQMRPEEDQHKELVHDRDDDDADTKDGDAFLNKDYLNMHSKPAANLQQLQQQHMQQQQQQQQQHSLQQQQHNLQQQHQFAQQQVLPGFLHLPGNVLCSMKNEVP